MTTTLTLSDVSVPAPPESHRDWNNDGVLYLRRLLPDDLIDAYCEVWQREHAHRGDNRGWQYCTPYAHHPEVADLCSYGPLQINMEALISEPVGLHLNLSDWRSTERDWHQDTYLNPPHVGDYYIAAWLALDDIHPDSGPFQYVPGSHRWCEVTREKIWEALGDGWASDPSWPRESERILTPLFEQEIEDRQAEVVTYLPKKGDVLLWHSRLLHRGSRAKVPGMERRALISHYSGIHHRQDMPKAVPHGGSWVFPIEEAVPV